MDVWEVMFREVREIVRATTSWEDGVTRAVALARRRPDLFDEYDYWNQVDHRDFNYSFDMVTQWARQGLEKIDAKTGWESLLLDLGDCPESFHMMLFGSEQEERLAPDVASLFSGIPAAERMELANRHVEELDDEILDWDKEWSDVDYSAEHGYWLWLVIGSLALMRPLRDVDSCKSVLNGREKLYLLAGFEGIFTYLATVTPNGLIYEYEEQPPEEPFVIKSLLSKNGDLLQGVFAFTPSHPFSWRPSAAMTIQNQPEDEESDLSSETSHPRAAELLKEPFFFDCTDEFSPLGNDTGADALSFFRRWRVENPETSPIVFLDEILESWGCMNAHWDAVESVEIQRLIRKDEFGLLVRDDTVIGLAFAQLVVEGVVDAEIKRRALSAIRRQALPAMIEFRAWTLPRQRLEKLESMRTALESV